MHTVVLTPTTEVAMQTAPSGHRRSEAHAAAHAPPGNPLGPSAPDSGMQKAPGWQDWPKASHAPPMAAPGPASAGAEQKPPVQVAPKGHALQAVPLIPQARGLSPVRHWPFEQQPKGQLEGPQPAATHAPARQDWPCSHETQLEAQAPHAEGDWAENGTQTPSEQHPAQEAAPHSVVAQRPAMHCCTMAQVRQALPPWPQATAQSPGRHWPNQVQP